MEQSSTDITRWLSDLDEHKDALFAAIRTGQVQVVTAQKFTEVIDRAKAAFSERTQAVAALAETEAQRNELAHALVCILRAFEGVAESTDEMKSVAKMLGVGEDGQMPSKANLAMKAALNVKQIMEVGGKVVGGFKFDWLAKIDFARVAEILQSTNPVNLSAYINFAEAFNSIAQSPQQHG